MARGKPEKPWKNIAPKPDPERLLKLDPKNIGSVEKTGPGIEYAFDADREMINEVAPKNNIAELVQELNGKEGDAALTSFSAFGKELMERVAEVGEGHKDRAWEMIDICAKQTGISFPHVIQVYVELFTLCSRPIDKWSIAESHPKKMRIQQFTCSYLKAQQDAGLRTEGLPCRALCLSAFQCASELSNVPANVALTKALTTDGRCEFTFIPQGEAL
jgi:hypothetical protein